MAHDGLLRATFARTQTRACVGWRVLPRPICAPRPARVRVIVPASTCTRAAIHLTAKHVHISLST